MPWSLVGLDSALVIFSWSLVTPELEYGMGYRVLLHSTMAMLVLVAMAQL